MCVILAQVSCPMLQILDVSSQRKNRDHAALLPKNNSMYVSSKPSHRWASRQRRVKDMMVDSGIFTQSVGGVAEKTSPRSMRLGTHIVSGTTSLCIALQGDPCYPCLTSTQRTRISLLPALAWDSLRSTTTHTPSRLHELQIPAPPNQLTVHVETCDLSHH